MRTLLFSLVFSMAMVSHSWAECFSSSEARILINQGVVLPLAAVTINVRGEIISGKLCRHKGRYIYKIKVRTPKGRIIQRKLPASL